MRQVWVGAGLKERTEGSEFREEGNLCRLLSFSIMGLGFFLDHEEEGDKCRED